ncbi:MAG TPA: hypothetical protein VGG16_14285 [Streptosporangiaceae bacterium]
MDENGVRTLLHGVADLEVPAAGVDLNLAMAGGRRLRRRRTLAAASSALAVVAAVAAFVASTVSASPSATVTPQGRATAAPSVGASPVPMPASAPDRFDPLVPYAAFGWLPSGYTVGGQGTSPASTTRSVQITAANGAGSEIALTVNARNACTFAGRSVTCAGTDGDTLHMEKASVAPEVNGRPAFWASDTQVGGYLLWQYAPGAWASLHVWSRELSPELPPAGERAMLEQTAARIRFGMHTPLRFPFWVHLPAGWTVSTTSFFPDPSGKAGPLLGRTLLGRTLLAGPAAGPAAADLDVWTPIAGNCEGTPDTALDGAPATLRDGSVCAENADGLTVYVSLNLTGPAARQPDSAGALALARKLHLLGGRVSAWTTRPLR